MDYYVKLTVETPVAIKFRGRDVFRIRITASDGENMPDEIFLHRKTLVNPNSGLQTDEFIAVCNPYDLSTYPTDEPAAGQDPPFYRLAAFDILVPGLTDADMVISEVEKQVEFMISLMKKLDKLQVIQTLWIPGEPTTTTTTTPEP